MIKYYLMMFLYRLIVACRRSDYLLSNVFGINYFISSIEPGKRI